MVMITVLRGQLCRLHVFQHSPPLVLAELTGSISREPQDLEYPPVT